jgi:hypothetical protein
MCMHIEMLAANPSLRNSFILSLTDRGMLHHQDIGRTTIQNTGQIRIVGNLLLDYVLILALREE